MKHDLARPIAVHNNHRELAVGAAFHRMLDKAHRPGLQLRGLEQPIQIRQVFPDPEALVFGIGEAKNRTALAAFQREFGRKPSTIVISGGGALAPLSSTGSIVSKGVSR